MVYLALGGRPPARTPGPKAGAHAPVRGVRSESEARPRARAHLKSFCLAPFRRQSPAQSAHPRYTPEVRVLRKGAATSLAAGRRPEQGRPTADAAL